MSNDDNIELKGRVSDICRGQFSVDLENGHSVNCTLSGNIRKNYIRIIRGDTVTVSLSPYDLSKGRITWRHPPKKDKESEELSAQSSNT